MPEVKCPYYRGRSGSERVSRVLCGNGQRYCHPEFRDRDERKQHIQAYCTGPSWSACSTAEDLAK